VDLEHDLPPRCACIWVLCVVCVCGVWAGPAVFPDVVVAASVFLALVESRAEQSRAPLQRKSKRTNEKEPESFSYCVV
jgi:hypothetical protein